MTSAVHLNIIGGLPFKIPYCLHFLQFTGGIYFYVTPVNLRNPVKKMPHGNLAASQALTLAEWN
jgi:hypothetical protein